MKKYKVILSNEMCSFLEFIITREVEHDHDDLYRRLTVAILVELMITIRKKRVEYKKEYKFSLSAAQALSICYLYNEYCNGDLSYQVNARMLQVNNQILQFYSI